MPGPVETSFFSVLDSQTDSLKHMNNAAYLVEFEKARWDFISKRGFGPEKINHLQQAPVVLEIQLKFKKELKAGMSVKIETQFENHEGKIARLRQTMMSPDSEQKIYCESQFVIGLLDLTTRRLIPLTKEWLEITGL